MSTAARAFCGNADVAHESTQEAFAKAFAEVVQVMYHVHGVDEIELLVGERQGFRAPELEARRARAFTGDGEHPGRRIEPGARSSRRLLDCEEVVARSAADLENA